MADVEYSISSLEEEAAGGAFISTRLVYFTSLMTGRSMTNVHRLVRRIASFAYIGVFTVVCHALYSNDDPGGFVLIPSGEFEMGDQLAEGMADEHPVHAVYVTGFEIEIFPVSYQLWRKVYSWAMENGYSFENEGRGKGDMHPVVLISFNDTLKWCNARSEMEGRSPAYFSDLEHNEIYKSGQANLVNAQVDWNADGYRLPTEAEWEKAARGGIKGKRFPWGNRISHKKANCTAVMNFSYDDSSSAGRHPKFGGTGRPYSNPVNAFYPNEFGLYDMAGNVWEMCWDRYDPDYYEDAPDSDPRGPVEGDARIVRGGSGDSPPFGCRAAFRQEGGPVNGGGESVGFRVVRGVVEAR